MKGVKFMSKSKMLRKSFSLLCIVLVVLFSFSSAFAIDGVWHNPLGYQNFYSSGEMSSTEPCERYPRDPVAGDNVYIKMTTWPIEMGQATWITWTKNGVAQADVGGSWKYNSGNNSYWEANLGSFAKGDVINYTVHANKDGTNEKILGSYSFTVTGWDWVTSVSGYTAYSNRFELTCNSNSGTFTPKINFYFPETDYFGMQFSPTGTGVTTTGAASFTVNNYTDYIWVSTTDIKLKILKNPYKLEVYKSDGTTLITKEYDRTYSRSLAWLTDGTTNGNYSVTKFEENLYTPSTEKFYGFGQRYNSLNKRGLNVDIYTVNEYLDQDDRAYTPVPFYLTNNKYGLFLNSTYYSQFRLATDVSDKCTIQVNAGGNVNKNLEMFFFTGSDYKTIIADYGDVSGKPALPPTWAFGPWISANEWNTQAEIEAEITATNNNSIPTSAIVIEQWSDEQTFYIWNDAAYTAKSGSGTFTNSDFTYGAKWPNPVSMVSNAHNNNIKILLWNAPCMQDKPEVNAQRTNDENYAISQGYVVKNPDGTPYRLPTNVWLGNSLTPDFTNPSASQWWFSKRAYLFDDVGIDGFKCDGGEFIWGRDLQFYNGKKGSEMRNAYPDLYVQAYYDYGKTKKSDSFTLSRAGGAKAQLHPGTWAGDQTSTFSAFQDAIRAGLSASISGIPFITWDLAGFNSDIPSTELYKRSVAQAAFSPIMQLHSESSNPSVSQARTPWNMALRTGDNSCLTIYRKFANMRMSLIPYLYSEAKYTSDNAVPMMRHMGIEFPDDSTAMEQPFQYMLGGSLLVAPIVESGTTNKSVYLPNTEWIDLFWNAQKPGNRSINYYADVDAMPVFAKSGSIIPMNLNSSYDFGGAIGNNLSTYNTLTFRIFPYGTTSYSWYDYVNSTSRTITSTESYSTNTETVSLPTIPVTSTLQVFSTKPSSVTLDGSAMTQYTSLSGFQGASSGWYYDSSKLLTYVKVGSGTSSRTIVLNGVNKASYEGEYAGLSGTATNTNHAGYLGTGFVDQFETQGDYVEFDIWSKTAGTYTVDFRYSAGAYNGQRSIYVNGTHAADLALSKTTDWDTWGTASASLTLNAGKNTIKMSYDSGDYTGINLDGIVVHQ